jgi:phosphatidylcholine synthase
MMNGDPAAADQPTETESNRLRRACAFAVHLLTASGAALALLALIAAADQEWPLMFFWLGAALIVDAVDGTIARYVGVSALLPRWSGDSLDFVVDFVTYVFVPAYAIAQSGLLPTSAAVPAGIIVATTGALYFADRQMKMADNCFRGFPALWNVAAFYLFVTRPDPWIGFAGVVVLAVLTFVRFPFVHPLRVVRLRKVNVVFLVIWSVLAAAAVGRNLDPGPWITAALCGIGLYFLGAGLLRRRS